MSIAAYALTPLESVRLQHRRLMLFSPPVTETERRRIKREMRIRGQRLPKNVVTLAANDYLAQYGALRDWAKEAEFASSRKISPESFHVVLNRVRRSQTPHDLRRSSLRCAAG